MPWKFWASSVYPNRIRLRNGDSFPVIAHLEMIIQIFQTFKMSPPETSERRLIIKLCQRKQYRRIFLCYNLIPR